MREMIVQFEGENWSDSEEAEAIEEEVQQALDEADIDYIDLHIR